MSFVIFAARYMYFHARFTPRGLTLVVIVCLSSLSHSICLYSILMDQILDLPALRGIQSEYQKQPVGNFKQRGNQQETQ